MKTPQEMHDDAVAAQRETLVTGLRKAFEFAGSVAGAGGRPVLAILLPAVEDIVNRALDAGVYTRSILAEHEIKAALAGVVRQ